MQIHNDEVLHRNRAHSASSIQLNGRYGSACLPPGEKFQEESFDARCVLKRGGFSIRLAESPEQHNETSALIKRMYSWRGYDTEGAAIPSRGHVTLEAFGGQNLVGTLTLGLDSEEGLLADELYGEKIGIFRKKGRKVCELSKLAIDSQYSSKELLASLFNLAYIHGRIIHKATDFFIEVNPRHAAYYKRLLGFRQVGEVRTCHRVNAPAVLLHLELDYVDSQVASLAGSPEPKQRSLYAYFLTKHQEEKVVSSLRHHLN